jgi:hypothetical protein
VGISSTHLLDQVDGRKPLKIIEFLRDDRLEVGKQQHLHKYMEAGLSVILPLRLSSVCERIAPPLKGIFSDVKIAQRFSCNLQICLATPP